jgi:hypothetical protein
VRSPTWTGLPQPRQVMVLILLTVEHLFDDCYGQAMTKLDPFAPPDPAEIQRRGAAQNVLMTWANPKPNPDVHAVRVAVVRAQWPALADALDHLVQVQRG